MSFTGRGTKLTDFVSRALCPHLGMEEVLLETGRGGWVPLGTESPVNLRGHLLYFSICGGGCSLRPECSSQHAPCCSPYPVPGEAPAPSALAGSGRSRLSLYGPS